MQPEEILVKVQVRIQPGVDLSPYLTQMLVRPYVDSTGRQVVTGYVDSRWMSKLASVSGVSSLHLAINPTQAPLGELLPPLPAGISKPEQQQRLAEMQSSPFNQRSLPEETTPMEASGWWDVGEGHHAAAAWANGYTGEGVKVLVNDTGIDFCHADMIGTWAVISDTLSPYDGWPVMFDSYSMYLYAQDASLATHHVENGEADYANTQQTCTDGLPCLYQPIGASGVYTYTLTGSSLSGEYHIGSHPDTKFEDFYNERIAILVVDENSAGVYDHVYMDLDGDHDFNDETPADRNTPIACLDNWDSFAESPGVDGYNDISGGLIYFISDGVNPIPASDWLWGGLTPGNGNLVAFMIVDPLQSGGAHGQWVASNVVAQGVVNGNAPAVKPPYTGAGSGLVIGTGQNVKIVGNGNFYQSIFLEDAFLFAALGYDGIAGTADDVQIVSNSWETSATDNGGWDVESRAIEEVMRNYPNLSVIFAAGNGGPGYGTQAGPVPPGALEVGSSTQFGSMDYFDSITNTNQITWGDAGSLSSAGPDARGGSGVDVMANGMVGSGDQALNASSATHYSVPDGWVATVNWRGTSRSAPVAAGVLALVYDAYRQAHGHWPDRAAAQALLMAGATDQDNDPSIQGAGLLNALNATNIAGDVGGFSVDPPTWTAGDYQGNVYPAFANLVYPGVDYSAQFTVTNQSALPESFSLTSDHLVRFDEHSFSFNSQNQAIESAFSNKRPDYLIDITSLIPSGTDLMEIRLVFPFSQFDVDSDYNQEQRWDMIVLDWTDTNGDSDLWQDSNGNGVVNSGEIDPYEYNRFNHDYNTGNSLAVRVSQPLGRMHDGIYLALSHAEKSISIPQTDFEIQMSFYRHEVWDWLALEPASLSIPAGSSANFTANVSIPVTTSLGSYAGYIRIAGGGQQTQLPVLANVAANTTTFTLGDSPVIGELYDNGRLFGLFDWSYRQTAGDWRLFFMDAPASPSNGSLVVHNDWQDDLPTDIDTLIYGPAEDIYSALHPDYYGSYTLGKSGGSVNTHMGSGKFSFQTTTGGTEEWVTVPLTQGLHVIEHHNVLYQGDMIRLPFTTTVGTVDLAPQKATIHACQSSGNISITLNTTLDLDQISASVYGVSQIQEFTSQQAYQDNPDDPANSSYTQTLSVAQGGLLDIGLSGVSGDDLDLYLFRDADDDGEFTNGEVISSSVGADSEERIRIEQPVDGDYLIVVNGWKVDDPPALFDLSIKAIQGDDLQLTGVPSGNVAAGTNFINLAWNKTVQEGESWTGIVFMGPTFAPTATQMEIEILPCLAYYFPSVFR